MDKITVSTKQAANISGASHRQLDYWVNNGIIEPYKNPKGQGRRRRWNYENVKLAARLATINCNTGRGAMSMEDALRLAQGYELHMGTAVMTADFTETDKQTKKLWYDEINE